MTPFLTHAYQVLNEWNQAKAGDPTPWQDIKNGTPYATPMALSHTSLMPPSLHRHSFYIPFQCTPQLSLKCSTHQPYNNNWSPSDSGHGHSTRRLPRQVVQAPAMLQRCPSTERCHRRRFPNTTSTWRVPWQPHHPEGQRQAHNCRFQYQNGLNGLRRRTMGQYLQTKCGTVPQIG